VGRDLRLGILGCGNVGSALAELLVENADLIRGRVGVGLEPARIAVRSTRKRRTVDLPRSVFTTDARAVVTDPSIDIVVEVRGGIEGTRELVLAALEAGKPVVTANKELMAACGGLLIAAAEASRVDLLFEAAVAGAIPLIRPLRESLAGDRIRRVLGIVNGTTNYILTRMTEEGSSFADALAEAQRLGYAEADPTADVGGHDAAAKAAIIASIAFGAEVTSADVVREGITAVTADDITSARDLGYVVKLLAVAEELDGEIAVRVHPAMVPAGHPLASVRDSFNALFLEADAAGDLMLYGRGAGGRPTASAVLGDVIDAARNLTGGSRGATHGERVERRVRPLDELSSSFFLRLDVVDQPGVLAAIAGVAGERGVSIESVRQHARGEAATLTFVTHVAKESAVRRWIEEVQKLPTVREVTSAIRVIGGEG
jgi:homoserine dehydrogenase